MDKKIKTARGVRSLFSGYIAHCEEAKRIANMAGFCAHCRISRGELSDLKGQFPHEFDIICAALLDCALNSKIANSGAIMEYVEALPETLCDASVAGWRVVCAHNAEEDGA